LNLISGKNASFYFLLEQATISNFFNLENFENQRKSSQTIDYLLKRLNYKEDVWQVLLEKNEIVFSKKENKVTESFKIKFSDFNDFNYVNLKKYSEIMQEYFLSKSFLKSGDQSIEIHSPRDLITKALDQSKKNYSVQRYKGLGEMNPDQLWQTTLDPEYRSILRVEIEDAQRADDVFEELMGDDVEKRKIFIQSNAKKVSNLDV
jgi:DNA gyrase subunit B